MVQRRIGGGLRVLAAAGIFAVGWLCGSLGQRSAEAQLGDVPKKMAPEGGSFGPTAELGSQIADMQKHVDALGKDLDAMRKVQAALGL
jgi:hypothetical protein